MKKVLLFFCLSFSLLFAKEYRSNHSYQALGFTQLPKVEVGGYINSMLIGRKQAEGYDEEVINEIDDLRNNNPGFVRAKHPDFALDSSLGINVVGINDYGLKYGAFIDLNANTTQGAFSETLQAKQAYIYSELNVGKIEFGSTNGASQKLKTDAGDLVRDKTGGIKGRYLQFINMPISENARYILIPQLPTAHAGFGVNYNCDTNTDINCRYSTLGTDPVSGDYTELAPGANRRIIELDRMQNALKLSYYTPEIEGFIVGASFTPDTGNRGAGDRNTNLLDENDIENVIEYGVSYTNSFYGIGVSLSYTGEMGDSQSKEKDMSDPSVVKYKPKKQKLSATQFGGILSFYGLSVGASVGNWNTSLQEEGENKTGSFQTIGLGYEFGPLLLSGTMFSSEFQKYQYEAVSANVEYKLSKNFYPYIEITQFTFSKPEDDTETKTNSGMIATFGFVLTF
ncbi:MAG: hypothetical protein Ta2D_06170 [Rickettsiales bacterium]|nr:MAG: hypothetical protein Ta2D_06170 [Rickettsiales bacterium]